MTEIFISYSRRDKTFVDRFLKGLSDNGYNPDNIWVDWEDIPASSKWEEEIRKGIEETNSVIFILSPEWAKSNECAKELKVAAEYNKRLFPIVWQNVDPNTIQKELASLNWIFFRETDNFDEAMQKLIAALHTDLAYVAQHTNLLRRANEWEAKSRDSGYLLRGGELQEAETWLSQASDDKQPRPNTLQSEYIFASRQDDVRRQRRNLIWVSTGLVISIILAIAAAVAGVEALRQSQMALASQLAAQATNLVSTQPDLSLLLSLESNYIGDELDTTDPGWLGSLLTSLNSSPKLGTFLRAHDSDVRAVSFSSDGHWLASAGIPSGGTGQVILWDMNSTADPRPFQKFTGGTKRFLAVGFSPDGKELVAGGDDSILFVWDPAKCCAPIHAWPVTDKVRALTFVSIQGTDYVALATGSAVTFWGLESGKMDNGLTLPIPTEDPTVRILSLAASLKTNLLAAGSEDGNVTVWDLNTHEVKFHACSYGDPATNSALVCHQNGQAATDIRGLAFNAAGTLLISGSSDHRAWLWDAQSGELLAQSAGGNEGGHINTISSVAFNPKNDHQVATVSWDNTVRIWNLIPGSHWSFERTDTLAGHSNSIWSTAFSPDGRWLASGSSDTTIILWKLNQVNQIGIPIAKMDGEVWALAAASSGRQLAAGDAAGNIRIWNFDGHTLAKPLELKQDGQVLTLAYSHDSKWLASAGVDPIINVWNTQTGELAWQIKNAHTDQIWQVMFSPNDKWLASASYDKTAKIWDTATHQQIGKTLVHQDPNQKDDRVFALTFNEDGTELLVAGYASVIYRWDVSDPASFQSLGPLTGHSAAVNSLAFDWKYPHLLASTSDDKSLLIWDISFEEHTQPVLGLNESMEAVTFRPKGDWLASATDNSTVLLWQLASKNCSRNWDPDTCQPGRIGTPLIGHRTPVENVVFLSDTKLVSSSEDGQLILWNLDKSFWYEHACSIVNRHLSDAEFNQYIAGKINNALLNTVAWFYDIFTTAPSQAAPSCISN